MPRIVGAQKAYLLIVLAVWACLSLANTAAAQTNLDDDPRYSQGLAAYLEGDFRLAQSHWLQSAKQKNSKAMFNLGLLHETGKLGGVDQAKAQRWFNLAGQNGYGAADYHVARSLIARGERQQAQKYIRRAAENGYGPAREMLGLSPQIKQKNSNTVAENASNINSHSNSDVNVEKSELSSAQAVISSAMAAPRQASRYLTEDWILSKDSEYWTIQILAFKELQRVQSFIDDHKIASNAAYFVEKTREGTIFKLVYGVFPSKQEADDARAKLSSSLKQHGPWLRSVASVKAIIAKQ